MSCLKVCSIKFLWSSNMISNLCKRRHLDQCSRCWHLCSRHSGPCIRSQILCSTCYFCKITKIEIEYCTNASKGVGTISAYYRSTSSTSTTGSTQISSTFNVTKPSSGGTTLKTATFTPSSTISGTNYVQFNVTCSTNSVYIYSVTVYYKTSS